MFGRSLVEILIGIPGIIIGLAFHEFAHAFVSDRLGDPTPRNQGRLTISPLPHIDPIGFLMILLLGFGWAKPVQINTRFYKKPRRDEILVSLAGPFTNLLIAFVFGFLTKVLLHSISFVPMSEKTFSIIYLMFDYVIWINIILFLFNLIPLPPLDGFHVLTNIIPLKYYKLTNFLYKYSTVVLILIIVTGATSYIISKPGYIIYSTITKIFR